MQNTKLLLVKLRTGEQIVGVSEENEDTILMRKPIKIHDSSEVNGLMYTFSYYLEDTEGENLTLSKKNDVFFFASPSQDMKKSLLQFLKVVAVEKEMETRINNTANDLIKFLEGCKFEQNEIEKLIQLMLNDPLLPQFMYLAMSEYSHISKDMKKEKKRKKAKKKMQTFDIPHEEKKDESYGNNPEDWSQDIKDYLQ